MTSKEEIQKLIDEIKPFSPKRRTSFSINEIIDMLERAVKDLEVLEILKPRIYLKYDTLRNDNTIVEVAFIEAKGFTFKNSNEYKLLKEWLDDK